jgi:uncharacterized lipoprotein YbaY
VPATKKPLVVGTITFEEGTAPFSGATVSVRLYDISYADAAAEVMAEFIQKHVTFDPQRNTGLAFTLTGPPPDSRGHYSLFVHIDLDGDGMVSQGDYITMQSYPVLTFGHPHTVTVQVRQVK